MIRRNKILMYVGIAAGAMIAGKWAIRRSGDIFRTALDEAFKSLIKYIEMVKVPIFDATDILYNMGKEGLQRVKSDLQMETVIDNWENGSGGVWDIKKRAEDRKPPMYLTTQELAFLVSYNKTIADPSIFKLGYHDPNALNFTRAAIAGIKSGKVALVHSMDLALRDLIKKNKEKGLDKNDIAWLKTNIDQMSIALSTKTYKNKLHIYFSETGYCLAKELLGQATGKIKS